jgi:hypothetical protein
MRAVLRGLAVLIMSATLTACGGGGGGSGSSSVKTYAVSGSVAHLSTSGLVLSDGQTTLSVAANATAFTFPTVAQGSSYSVTVATQPANLNCAVTQGAGTIAGANIDNVVVQCATSLTAPIAVGVLPAAATQTTSPRVFIPVAVGNSTTGFNAILDTGSAGVVLNAFKVFPASMVSSSGFIFPSGQASITYNGITVTKIAASRSYGLQSANPTTVTGNLGYAQLTFGTGANVTTAAVPIVFFYQLQNGDGTLATDLSDADNLQDNFIGINPALESVTLNSVTPSDISTVCSGTAPSNCGLVSPLRSVTFVAGVDSGYLLEKVSLQSCAIITAGSCVAQNALMVGLNSSNAQNVTFAALSCTAATDAASASFENCSQVIRGSTISASNDSFIGPVIIDSGAATARISVPSGATFPATLAAGTPVSVTLGSFLYQFTTGTGPASTSVTENAAASDYSNTGIEFFTHSALVVDYASGSEGWR